MSKPLNIKLGFRFPVVVYVSFTLCLFIFLFALLYAIICSVNGSISPEESLKFYPLNSLAHCYGNSVAERVEAEALEHKARLH